MRKSPALETGGAELPGEVLHDYPGRPLVLYMGELLLGMQLAILAYGAAGALLSPVLHLVGYAPSAGICACADWYQGAIWFWRIYAALLLVVAPAFRRAHAWIAPGYRRPVPWSGYEMVALPLVLYCYWWGQVLENLLW